MNFANCIWKLTLAFMLGSSIAHSQTEPAPAPPKPSPTSVQTFRLTNISQVQDANEVLTALRNMLDPRNRINLVASQNTIMVEGTPDQLALAQRVINDLDRPKKAYRLTFAITDMDGGKHVGTQHFSMIAASGQRTVLKQGNRVPVVTGSPAKENNEPGTQVTYLDIGMIFDATVNEFANGVTLRTKVEQSSIAEERSGVGPQDPIVRVSSFEGSSFLTFGKPLILGSLDVPGSTRHLDIDVVVEPIQ